jgi:hypothetical protein
VVFFLLLHVFEAMVFGLCSIHGSHEAKCERKKFHEHCLWKKRDDSVEKKCTTYGYILKSIIYSGEDRISFYKGWKWVFKSYQPKAILEIKKQLKVKGAHAHYSSSCIDSYISYWRGLTKLTSEAIVENQIPAADIYIEKIILCTLKKGSLSQEDN